MTLSHLENRMNLGGVSVLAASSAISVFNSFEKVSLITDPEKLYEKEVESVSQKLCFVSLSTFLLLRGSWELGDLGNRRFLMCSFAGGALHLALRSYISGMKEEQLVSSIGEHSTNIENSLEIQPYNYEDLSTEQEGIYGWRKKSVKLTYERIEKRSLPSYVNSLLRVAHTTITIGHLSRTAAPSSWLIGGCSIGGNLIDQLQQTWVEKVKVHAQVTPIPSENLNFPVYFRESGEKGMVHQPVYIVEFEASLSSDETQCLLSNCSEKKLFSSIKVQSAQAA